MNKVYTKIESIVGNVITVRAEGVRYKAIELSAQGMRPGFFVFIRVFAL